MSTLFFTDPHLGLPRQANTTPASAAALQQALFDQANLVLGSFYRDARADQAVCLGDVFDRFSNPESVIQQGHEIVSQCALVLSGNHDVTNRSGSFGSLQLVDHALRSSSLGVPPCVFAPFGEAYAATPPLIHDRLRLVAVPHVASQELFEQSLGVAVDVAEQHPGGPYYQALLLHCNYNLSESFATETSLNLIDEHIEELLTSFDYILLGHEHKPADHYDGRVIVLGNTHPTGFGDISDKRIAVWDGKKFKFERIWSMKTGYAEYQCNEIPRFTGANFVRIKGEATTSTMLQISKDVAAMWEKSPALYAVKVDIALPELQAVDGQAASRSLSQLPDIIRRELEAEPKLLALWDQLAAEEREQ